MMGFTLFRFICILAVYYSHAPCTYADNNDKTDDLEIEVLSKPESCGETSKPGNMLEVHFTGFLENGTQFDSSYDYDQTYKFQIGGDKTIKGFNQGLGDMCVGEKRKLTIPPHLGYGDEGAGEGKIPGGATIIFEVELMSIEEAPEVRNIFKEIDEDNDKLLSEEEVSIFFKKQQEEQGDMLDIDKHNDILKDIFKHEDQDQDGFISHDEFSGPKHDEL